MKQEKQETILIAARKMFARYGLGKTNLDELARVARVAKGTIYKYFGSKKQVYLDVLLQETIEIEEKISCSVAKETSPERKLFVFAHAKFRYMRQAKNILNMDREGLDQILPGADKIRNDFFKREVNIISSILSAGADKGDFHLTDVFLMATAIAHAFRGFELNWLVHESDEQIDHYLDELLKVILYGLIHPEKG